MTKFETIVFSSRPFVVEFLLSAMTMDGFEEPYHGISPAWSVGVEGAGA
jgi:hypothetical protein